MGFRCSAGTTSTRFQKSTEQCKIVSRSAGDDVNKDPEESGTGSRRTSRDLPARYWDEMTKLGQRTRHVSFWHHVYTWACCNKHKLMLRRMPFVADCWVWWGVAGGNSDPTQVYHGVGGGGPPIPSTYTENICKGLHTLHPSFLYISYFDPPY
jgi:hypothetical protein